MFHINATRRQKDVLFVSETKFLLKLKGKIVGRTIYIYRNSQNQLALRDIKIEEEDDVDNKLEYGKIVNLRSDQIQKKRTHDAKILTLTSLISIFEPI